MPDIIFEFSWQEVTKFCNVSKPDGQEVPVMGNKSR